MTLFEILKVVDPESYVIVVGLDEEMGAKANYFLLFENGNLLDKIVTRISIDAGILCFSVI